MAQEDQSQRCNFSGINVTGKSSGKRPKEKKIPQRGLGVAQLEKIRLEEQRKRVTHYQSSSSSVSFLSVSNNAEAPRPNNGDIPGNFNLPKLWNMSCDHLNLPQEFNPIWTQQSHHPIPSVVNFPIAPSSISSVSSFQMELPSNQNYSGNHSLICRPEEEIQMLGNKRRYEFADIDQPGSSLNSKFLTFDDPIRVNRSTSSENKVTLNSEYRDSNLRELDPPSCSTSISEPKSTQNMRENNALNGNFLTLSLSTTTPNLPSCLNCEIPDFDTAPFQGTVNGQKLQDEQSESSQYLPLYSFFPPAKKHNYESAEATRNCRTSGTDDQNIDLNLKL